jgi:hypothetical protein
LNARLRLALPHAVMLVAAVLLYVAAARIDVDTGGRIGPAAWPKAILAIMALLCLYEIVKRLATRSADSATGVLDGLTDGPGAQPDAAPPEREYPRKLAGGIALVAAYVLGVPWLGFFVSTALFLAIFPCIGGYRRLLVSGGLALAGSFVLVVIFMRVAYVSLPLGEGPFKSLSLALLRLLGVS